MAAPQRPSRSQAWSLLKRKQHLLVKFILAMSMITLLSLITSAEVETYLHMSTSQGRSLMQQGMLKWGSRRALLQDKMQGRQAPQGFPPPQGNALVNKPHKAPPRRPSFDGQNGRPAARLPENAHHFVPPPHP